VILMKTTTYCLTENFLARYHLQAGAKGSKPSPSPCISSPTSTPHSGHAGDACVPGIPRRTAGKV
jgi:hypothetical protein